MIGKNMYSFEIDPILALTSSSNAHYKVKHETEGPEEIRTDGHAIKLGKTPFQFDLESVSTLTLGGYDPNDVVGNLTWYDTSDCIGGWNITASNLAIGDESIMPNSTQGPVVEMQTAYPYIGLAEVSWNATMNLINSTWNPDASDEFTC